jgi:hypothetical protein
MSQLTIANFGLEVLYKTNRSDQYLGYFQGHSELHSVYTYRDVNAFSEVTFKLVGTSAVVNPDSYLLYCTVSGSCFLVCMSNDTNYNHLIAARVLPVAM